MSGFFTGSPFTDESRCPWHRRPSVALRPVEERWGGVAVSHLLRVCPGLLLLREHSFSLVLTLRLLRRTDALLKEV